MIPEFRRPLSVLTFSAMSVPYMLATPLWGWLADTCLPSELISPSGNILIFCSLLIIGPANYIPIQPDYLLTEIGLGILGVGTAATLTATFSLAQKHSLEALEYSGDSHSVISGLWTAAFAFGNFLGPTVGGPFVEWLGFTGTTPVLQIWAFIMLITDIVTLIKGGSEIFMQKEKQENDILYMRLD